MRPPFFRRGLIYFERDILAHNVNILNIHALEYTGYVAHVCDMKSYFDENLKLTDDENLEKLFPKKSPVYTKIRDDNPTRYVPGCKVTDSILADGCVIEGTVENCVLFRGVKVKKGAVVKNCVLMQDTVVEANAELDCVVTDKNVKITAGKKLSGTESFPVYVQKKHPWSPPPFFWGGDLRILYAASEAAPFAKSGGLADVAGALPKALVKDGVDARVIMPLYGDLKFRDTLEYVTNYSVPVGWRSQYCGLFKTERNGVTYYFLDNEYYFKRRGLYGFYDDGERFAFFSRAVLETATDKNIPFNYDITNFEEGKAKCKEALQDKFGLNKDGSPVFAMVSRMVGMKGFDLVQSIADGLVDRGIELVILGSGESQYENFFSDLCARHPGRVGTYIGFSWDVSAKSYEGLYNETANLW